MKYNKDWDFNTFCIENNLDKYDDKNYQKFLEFEQIYLKEL